MSKVEKKKIPINISLDAEKDEDIIEYLSDVPKTWIIKKALRLLIEIEKRGTEQVIASPSKTPTTSLTDEVVGKDDNDELPF